jgi:hypothetical protein
MLIYGLYANRTWKGVKRWLHDFASANDVVFLRSDVRPFMEQLGILAQFRRVSLERGVSLLEATTADIEWNGEP